MPMPYITGNMPKPLNLGAKYVVSAIQGDEAGRYI